MLARLIDLLFPLYDTAKVVRETDEETLGNLVSPTHLASGVVALLPYRHRIVRSLIIEAKFRRNERACNLLGSVLREYLSTLTLDGNAYEKQRYVVVPIPLGEKRRRERGYNQVEEIAAAAGIVATPVLVRTRETQPQTSLPGKDRHHNMKDSFAVTHDCDPTARYIVIDDVSTTGATLAAARAALAAAGVTPIYMVALAH